MFANRSVRLADIPMFRFGYDPLTKADKERDNEVDKQQPESECDWRCEEN